MSVMSCPEGTAAESRPAESGPSDITSVEGTAARCPRGEDPEAMWSIVM
ncbi:hypothetical protein STANM337S_00765 [Streptomyces tanashiensis]